MKILEQEFDSRGFHFKQLKRDGMLGVFEKTNDKGYKGFETVRIKSHNGYEIAGTFIAPAESMPSSETWGTDGFSYSWSERDKAFAKLEWMKNEQFKIENPAQTNDNQPIKRGRGRPKKIV